MEQLEGVGARIKLVRRDKGMTQGDLAQAVGVSRSAVAQWETGRAGQLSANLSRIAGVLEVGVEYLLHGEDKHGSNMAASADEWALLRLYRECGGEDRQTLLRLARRLRNVPTSA